MCCRHSPWRGPDIFAQESSNLRETYHTTLWGVPAAFGERVSPAETAGDLCERDMLNGINGERRGLYYDGNSLSYTHQAASGGVQLSSLVSAVVPEPP
jgi:hypothetical protein